MESRGRVQMITLAGFIIGIGCWDLQLLLWWVGAGIFCDALFVYGLDKP